MTSWTAIVASVGLLSFTAGAQPAPFHHYRTLETPHFRVTVPAGLEREGRVAGAAAERAYALLSKELKPPRGTIDLVVTDDADYSNGYATPVPSNRVVVFAAPPVENNALRLNEDWLQLVITHELTHIFHLDRTGGVWSLAQHIFGRGPALFPNLYGPSWLTEGIAVYYESRFTEGGRLKDSEHRLLARAAAADQRLPHLNELSLGSALFPGGERAYGYGSLFVDYLARTRGDSTIERFVEAQSRALIPFTLDRDAKRAFGISFQDAFEEWRDSVQKSVKTFTPPLAGWRELTTHPYYALSPRWVNDTTLVYAGSDGRSTAAEYRLGLNGGRRRIGRRNSLGSNVPVAGGGLLFAQIDYETPDIARSDLYVERDGEQKRLTHGMRLVQPDVRSGDGAIVAVQLDAARASLMLLSADAREHRLLRSAAPDETWSEPRWSPDGSEVAVVHRVHGGIFSLDVLDVANGTSTTLHRGAYLLSSPTWSRDGRTVLYITEESGVPTLAGVSRDSQLEGGTGIYNAELSPDAHLLAASVLRADGFHIGIAPVSSPERSPVAPVLESAPIDSQPLAPGEYHAYHAWRSALPTYWYPFIEAAPSRGTRLGLTSSGHDVVYRHIYDGYLAVPTTGSYPTGRLTYRYAGFRAPYVDVQVTQDYTTERTFVNGGTPDVVGALLRRSRTATMGLTFVRPRVRTYASFSLGAGMEHRDFVSDPGEFLKQLTDSTFTRYYVFPNAYVSASWSNLQRPGLSISPEDGISLSATARQQWQSDLPSTTRSNSVVGVAAAFKSLDFPGFAHHVLALRLAGGIADRKSASSFVVGGTSGTTVQIVPGYSIGDGRRTFGVRGFPTGSVYGTSAATGTLEYRLPLSLTARGIGALPFFFDRASVAAFADAGVAGCVADPRLTGVCAPAGQIGRTIGSVGGELLLSAAILDWDSPQSIRVGLAAPTVGRDVVPVRAVSAYLAYGLSF